jgi:hypothetical protein
LQIESISIDTLRLNEKEDGAINMASEDSARPSPHPDTDVQANPTFWNKLNSFSCDTQHWVVTHPNTIAMFLVFVASALLARSAVGSVQSLVGVACLFAGLKIMAATEDGFELSHK